MSKGKVLHQDDHWDNFTAPDDFSLGPTEVSANAVYDMGLDMCAQQRSTVSPRLSSDAAVAANRAEISAVRAAYSWSMDQMYRALRDKQKFAWQLLCEPSFSPAPAALVL